MTVRHETAVAEINETYPEPVGGGGEGHAWSTVAGWVQLSDNSPDERTPGGGEGNNEQAGENDEDVAGLWGGGWVLLVKHEVANEGVDHEANERPGSTSHESLSATALGDNVETSERAADVDGTKNDLGNVGVGQTGGGEDSRSVVEEEVGTGKLLTSLESHTKDGTVEHTWTSEDLEPGSLLASLLLLKLDADLRDLGVDLGVVWLNTSETSDDLASILLAALAVGETWGLWEEQDTSAEDESPEERKTVWNSPGGAGGHGLGTVVDHLSRPDTEGDEQLVRSNEDTTDDPWSRLRLVHWHDDGEGANTNTVNTTTNGELGPRVLRGDLDNCTNHGEESGDGDGETTTDDISHLSGNKGSDKGTSAEQRSNGTLPDSSEVVLASGVQLAEATSVVFHGEET